MCPEVEMSPAAAMPVGVATEKWELQVKWCSYGQPWPEYPLRW